MRNIIRSAFIRKSESLLGKARHVRKFARHGDHFLNSTPRELDRSLDVRVQALVHWAGISSTLHFLFVLETKGVRHMNPHFQALDPSRTGDGHFFSYGCRGADNVDVQRSGHDARH